jgi:YVTN family beta-propeller protein
MLSSSSFLRFFSLFLTLAALSRAADPAPGPSGYKLAASWRPGGEGRWDLLAVDSTAGRLYVTRENRLQVLDITTGALIGEVSGLNGAHGVALVPSLHRGFASSGRDNKVVVFDLATLTPVADPIPAGTKPDAMAVDPATNRVFVMNGGSDNIIVIDPATAKAVGTIALPGAPEMAVADGAGHLFVNLEDKNQTVAIDTHALKVTSVWPLAPGASPSGLALDPANHILFAACANRHFILLDDTTGRIVADIPIGMRVDGAAFDPGTGYAFSPNGDGTLTVAAAGPDGHWKVIDTVPTKVGARTIILDPATHALYLPTADFGPPDASSHGRPKPLPGTFVVLKFTR